MAMPPAQSKSMRSCIPHGQTREKSRHQWQGKGYLVLLGLCVMYVE